MSQEKIIKPVMQWAEAAGFGRLLTVDGLPAMWIGSDIAQLERAYSLAYAAGQRDEREACAQLCDHERSEWGDDASVTSCAVSIRARGIHP